MNIHHIIQLICWAGGLCAGTLALWLGYEVAVIKHAGKALPVSTFEVLFAFSFLVAAMAFFAVIADKAAEHARR